MSVEFILRDMSSQRILHDRYASDRLNVDLLEHSGRPLPFIHVFLFTFWNCFERQMGYVFRCWQHRRAVFLPTEGSISAQAGARGLLLSPLVPAQEADIALYCPLF